MIAMPHWDVFHSERLEAERNLTTQAVRDALARGDLVDEDLVRPAGETRWSRLGDSPEFGPLASPILPDQEDPPAEFQPPSIDEEEDDSAESELTRFEFDPDSLAAIEREALARAEREPSPEFDPPPQSYTDFEVVYEDDDPEPVLPDDQAARPDLPELDLGIVARTDVFKEGAIEEEFDPLDEDDEAAEFTLSRNSAEKVEELDLAAMVDVAFQLVLFFLVTAQVVLFKTLEVPRPNEDKPPEAAAQGRSKSVDELEKDYILVEVDAAGSIKVDRQPVNANRAALVETLRTSREKTARKAMLLSADFATRHENAVLVFDVANEIDLRIAIAQPTGKK
jgi:biopolymer transport protein ExbD